MAKTTASERARLFVALDPPPRARSALAAWRDELFRGRDDVRPVPEAALHVTLAFLGWRAVGEVDAITAAALGAAELGAAAPSFTPAGVAAVPPRRPRLFALDLVDEDGRGAALQGSVARALAAGGFYEREARAFWPHITLARVRRGARPRPPAEPRAPADPFPAAALTLYRSVLHRHGARYEQLARLRL